MPTRCLLQGQTSPILPLDYRAFGNLRGTRKQQGVSGIISSVLDPGVSTWTLDQLSSLFLRKKERISNDYKVTILDEHKIVSLT